jgi:cytochrome c biogenesis protein CcmG/thiol:disulfide interchange protein DsbE
MSLPGLDLAEKLDEKPYSGIPLENRRDWVVPKWLKEVFVAFAILCVLCVAASKIVARFSGRLERAAGSLDADALEGNAPDFTLPLRGNNGALELSKEHGKLVLVNFWASWCAPCRDEEPSMDKLATLLDPATFELIAVSADEGWAPVEKFFGARVPGYQVVLDEDGKVRDRWGTNKFPESYLVDAKGELKFKVIGPRDWTSPDALALLEQLGARRKAATP